MQRESPIEVTGLASMRALSQHSGVTLFRRDSLGLVMVHATVWQQRSESFGAVVGDQGPPNEQLADRRHRGQQSNPIVRHRNPGEMEFLQLR